MDAFSKYTPNPWKWSDLDGEQVTIRVIRSEGLEHTYLFHKDAIYLVSARPDDTTAEDKSDG